MPDDLQPNNRPDPAAPAQPFDIAKAAPLGRQYVQELRDEGEVSVTPAKLRRKFEAGELGNIGTANTRKVIDALSGGDTPVLGPVHTTNGDASAKNEHRILLEPSATAVVQPVSPADYKQGLVVVDSTRDFGISGITVEKFRDSFGIDPVDGQTKNISEKKAEQILANLQKDGKLGPRNSEGVYGFVMPTQAEIAQVPAEQVEKYLDHGRQVVARDRDNYSDISPANVVSGLPNTTASPLHPLLGYAILEKLAGEGNHLGVGRPTDGTARYPTDVLVVKAPKSGLGAHLAVSLPDGSPEFEAVYDAIAELAKKRPNPEAPTNRDQLIADIQSYYVGNDQFSGGVDKDTAERIVQRLEKENLVKTVSASSSSVQSLPTGSPQFLALCDAVIDYVKQYEQENKAPMSVGDLIKHIQSKFKDGATNASVEFDEDTAKRVVDRLAKDKILQINGDTGSVSLVPVAVSDDLPALKFLEGQNSKPFPVAQIQQALNVGPEEFTQRGNQLLDNRVLEGRQLPDQSYEFRETQGHRGARERLYAKSLDIVNSDRNGGGRWMTAEGLESIYNRNTDEQKYGSGETSKINKAKAEHILDVLHDRGMIGRNPNTGNYEYFTEEKQAEMLRQKIHVVPPSSGGPAVAAPPRTPSAIDDWESEFVGSLKNGQKFGAGDLQKFFKDRGFDVSADDAARALKELKNQKVVDEVAGGNGQYREHPEHYAARMQQTLGDNYRKVAQRDPAKDIHPVSSVTEKAEGEVKPSHGFMDWIKSWKKNSEDIESKDSDKLLHGKRLAWLLDVYKLNSGHVIKHDKNHLHLNTPNGGQVHISSNGTYNIKGKSGDEVYHATVIAMGMENGEKGIKVSGSRDHQIMVKAHGIVAGVHVETKMNLKRGRNKLILDQKVRELYASARFRHINDYKLPPDMAPEKAKGKLKVGKAKGTTANTDYVGVTRPKPKLKEVEFEEPAA